MGSQPTALSLRGNEITEEAEGVSEQSDNFILPVYIPICEMDLRYWMQYFSDVRLLF